MTGSDRGRGAERLPSLDGLRAISVLLVVGAHLALSHTAPAFLEPVLHYADGALGVRVFFCISGLLITYLLLDEREATGGIHIGRFYIRRAIRIMPVYYMYLTVAFALAWATGVTTSACQLLTAATFTKNYGCQGWIDIHLWSLSVEEQYYLVWPLVAARLSTKRMLVIALLAVAASPVSRVIEYLDGHRTFFWLTSNVDALMLGSLGGYCLAHRPPWLGRALRFQAPLFRAVAIIALFIPNELGKRFMWAAVNVAFGGTLQSLLSTYLILSLVVVRSGRLHRLLNGKAMVQMGVLSYSIYIWQQLFLVPTGFYGAEHAVATWPYNCICIVAVAWMSYTVLERPLARLRHRFGLVAKRQTDLLVSRDAAAASLVK